MFAIIIGGSGSGKSEFAENLAVTLDPSEKIYIATMYPWDEESKERIKKHQKMRAEKNFITLECFYNLNETISSQGKIRQNTVLLECMSNLVANEMYCEEGYAGKKPGDNLVDYVMKGILLLKETFEHVIIVSNDVFLDGTEYDDSMNKYLINLATMNQEIAKEADMVVELVCGIPIYHKGEAMNEASVE